jgi:predicted enzyme related to lactoylglutathione lyase
MEITHMRVVHFEIPADNPARATKFYADVFGWQVKKWDGPQDYWLASTGAATDRGIDGGFLKRSGPDHGVVNTIDVPKIDEAIANVTKHGGTIVMPKVAIPHVGWLAYFKDTEGNVTGMMQADPTAT